MVTDLLNLCSNFSQRRHHLAARGGDGSVLQLLPAGAEARRLRGHLLAQVQSQDHAGDGAEARGRLRHLLADRQVLVAEGAPRRVQPG